jgi:hypothetical protein
MTTLNPRLKPIAAQHPHPLVFITVSGAHLYGFPSPDSDWDLRGVHVLPLEQVIGLREPNETVKRSHDPTAAGGEPVDLDLVTHDLKKFMRLMLKKNGYVLEQLHSPLVVHTTPEHEELKAFGRSCVTRHHVHHYLGFAQNQWKLFAKESPPHVKPLLYVYRVLLTGIHLMRSGEVEANLLTLNESFGLPYIDDLVARKTGGPERSTLSDADMALHRGEFERLEAMLREAGERSTLPEAVSAQTREAMNDLLLRVRMRQGR